MADAPSGGKGWEPFEIALVVILVAGVLMHFSGKTTTTTDPKSSNTNISAPTTIEGDTCGLTINRPHSLEVVSGNLTLIGTASGCTWTPRDGVALYAQIIDKKGVPVSVYTKVVASDTGAFATSIPVTSTPTKGIGYLILVSTQTQNDHTTSVRVPIKFQ